jgi:hypothetical protein
VPPYCEGGRITWYRSNPAAPGGREVVGQGDTYTVTPDDEGYPIYYEVECPDPTSPTDYGEPLKSGPTRPPIGTFNPYIYNYFRWKGSFSTRVGASYVSNNVVSSWQLTTGSRYGQIDVAVTSLGWNLSGPQGEWTASAELTGPYAFGGSPVTVKTNDSVLLGQSTAGVDVDEPSSVIIQTVEGKWEFSFNGTDVIEEWFGIPIPDP